MTITKHTWEQLDRSTSRMWLPAGGWLYRVIEITDEGHCAVAVQFIPDPTAVFREDA